MSAVPKAFPDLDVIYVSVEVTRTNCYEATTRGYLASAIIPSLHFTSVVLLYRLSDLHWLSGLSRVMAGFLLTDLFHVPSFGKPAVGRGL